MSAAGDAGLARIRSGGREVEIEYQWLFRERGEAPLLVFLHEGLGSVSMWRDFPRALCQAGGWRGLVYSREGYGRSTPRPPAERWPVQFMEQQAQSALPALLERLGVDSRRERPWLFGHSDGGSIALLHAAAYPDRVGGLVVLAPHIFVEELSIDSIRKARDAYAGTDLRSRLARHHADPDSAFYGWNDVWLDPAFRHWQIRDRLALIRCPILAVQGEDDEYGSLLQIDGIRQQAPQTELLKLADCGHSPHRDQAEPLTRAVVAFIGRHTASSRPLPQPAV